MQSQLLYDSIVKLHLYTIRHCLPVTEELEQQEISSICKKYGPIVFLSVDKHVAYVRFDNYVSCFLIIRSAEISSSRA
jgi:hypothetical protein